MLRRILLPLTALLCTVSLCGCSLLSFGARPDWDAADYNIDGIKALALAQNANLGHITEDDCTDEALHAYNTMLGYVENVLGIEYKVYDFYHVDFDAVKSYVIKIVAEDDIAEAETAETPSSDTAIMLSCEENGSGVKSGVVPYLMARHWESDLFGEIGALYPDAQCSTFYIALDHIHPAVKADQYPDIRDYTYYLNEKSYHGSYKLYDADIRITLPENTDEAQVRVIVAELLPILKKYCVTELELYCCSDADAETLLWKKYYTVRANTTLETVQ